MRAKLDDRLPRDSAMGSRDAGEVGRGLRAHCARRGAGVAGRQEHTRCVADLGHMHGVEQVVQPRRGRSVRVVARDRFRQSRRARGSHRRALEATEQGAHRGDGLGVLLGYGRPKEGLAPDRGRRDQSDPGLADGRRGLADLRRAEPLRVLSLVRLRGEESEAGASRLAPHRRGAKVRCQGRRVAPSARLLPRRGGCPDAHGLGGAQRPLRLRLRDARHPLAVPADVAKISQQG
mmetsp:Transcript_111742/g.312347  ORF Transcript_111742/g.312347 Transcript_111742/m.312347 type:complete len:234 (-) Transcript_111742:245-946(-)